MLYIYGSVIVIANVFDALESNRVYKKAWEFKKIIRFFIEKE